MAKVTIFCPQCKQYKPCEAGRANRAKKLGLLLYCGKSCSSLGRRKDNPKSPRNPEWKTMKREYDKSYRDKNLVLIRAKKAAHYAKVGPLNRDKERDSRKERMPKHVEYCRQPEYRAKKVVYDRRRRAELQFGEYAESFLAVQELDREIASRMDNYELAVAKGTVNKNLQRRRDYERRTGHTKANRKQPEGFPLGHPQQDQVRQHATSSG